jgi:uridine phosphorylase
VRIKGGEVAPIALLPGDPDRVPKIITLWDEAREVTRHRGYVVSTGRMGGNPLSVCSTGIGAPSTAIAIEELARTGCRAFIRVGSMGAIQPGIRCGDLVIASAAVRMEGCSRQYVGPEYPAAADIQATLALIEAARSMGARYHVGYVASTDSFYCGQARRGYAGYWQSWMDDIIPDLQMSRVLGFEMESALIFVLCSLYGLRAGSVLAVFGNRATGEASARALKGERDCIRVACEATRILYEKGVLKKT